MATLTGFYKDNEGSIIDKDTEAALVYKIDWSDWLLGDDTISSSSWTLETISGDSDPLTTAGNTTGEQLTDITLQGGTSGNIYKVYNTITTASGVTDRRYFRVKVVDRSL
jgi:hypothetical protein